MKILAFADLHITNSHSKFRFDSDGISDLLKAQLSLVRHISQVAISGEYEAIVFLGDFLDKNILDPIVATFANRMMRYLLETGLPVIILEGNHCISDEKNLYTIVGSMSELSNYPNAYFVTENETIRIDDTVFHCFPYKSDYKEIEKEIGESNQSLDDEMVNIMLFHLPTTNAVLDNGCPSEKGVNLSQDIIDNFDICLGGDFHKPQKLVNTDNAFYVGAPFDLKFGQDGERGFRGYDISKGKFKEVFEPNPFEYPMITLNQSEALSLVERDEDYSMTLLKVEGEVNPEVSVMLKEERGRFYSISIPNFRAKAEKREARAMSSFSVGQDVHIIRTELENLTKDKTVIDSAIEILSMMTVE